MKKAAYYTLMLLFAVAAGCKKDNAPATNNNPQNQSPVYTEKDIYYYSFTNLEGKKVNISDFKGKKIMFVNTVSFCGNTPQYEALEKLYIQYKDKLVIIGFPCNQFGEQEPGNNENIKEFCTKTYGITFPMSEKIDVQGNAQDPIYKWLTSKSLNGKMDSQIAWNFQKYLVDEKGQFVTMFENYTQPDDPSIKQAIEK